MPGDIKLKLPIYFFSEKVRIKLKNRKKLKRFIDFLISQERHHLVSINFIFCSDKALLKTNQKYLGHDFYTDIITFDLGETQENIFAEIYISVDRVKENAQMLNRQFTEELHRVIFHGVLHLCKYNDKKPADKAIMTKKEDFYLDRYFNRFT